MNYILLRFDNDHYVVHSKVIWENFEEGACTQHLLLRTHMVDAVVRHAELNGLGEPQLSDLRASLPDISSAVYGILRDSAKGFAYNLHLIPHSCHQFLGGGRCTMPQRCISSVSFMLIGSLASCQCSKSTIELRLGQQQAERHTNVAGHLTICGFLDPRECS